MRPAWKVVVLIGGMLLGLSAQAYAQAHYASIDRQTTVRSVGFRFVDTQSFETSQLRENIVLRSTYKRFRIPFTKKVAPTIFSPIELQKDVVRLRRFYQQNGYPRADIGYLIDHDTTDNEARVQFLVDEGAPLFVRQLEFVTPDQRPPSDHLDEQIQKRWLRFREQIEETASNTLTETGLLELQSEMVVWLQNQGHAFAEVEVSRQVFPSENVLDIQFQVDPGPRCRIDEIQIEGHVSVEDKVIMRALPFKEGDWFSNNKMRDGQQQVFRLQLFRFAAVEVPPQTRDSTVTIHVSLQEGKPRKISLQPGYTSDRGLLGRVEWTHYNFGGGTQSLTTTLLGQTGYLATAPIPKVLYSASVSLLRPHIFINKLNGLVAPFIDYRDDLRDQSWAFGSDFSVFYDLGRFRRSTLQYSISSRQFIEYKLEDVLAGNVSIIDFIRQISALNSLDRSIQTSTVTLSTSLGKLDDYINPSKGYSVSPYFQVSFPDFLSTLQYSRLGLTFTGYWELKSGVQLVGRLRTGWLVPFGKSIPSADDEIDGFNQFLRLRDQVFFGGGSNDVRGWPEGLMGPKFPDVRILAVDTTENTATFDPRNRYIPFGGFNQISGSIEARFDAPFLPGAAQLVAFFDTGRIWTQDKRYIPTLLPELQEDGEKLFFSTGLGINYPSPLGPIQASIGYKINPALLDMRDPRDVWSAIENDTPVVDVPQVKYPLLARLNFHISLGRLN